MTSYNAQLTDSVIVANTSSSATTIFLPTGIIPTGQTYKIIDGSGNASVNNILINGNGNNINAGVSLTINTNYTVKTLIFIGLSKWIAY